MRGIATRAWHGLAHTARTILEPCIGASFGVATETELFPEEGVAATLRLVDVANGMELDLSVATSLATAKGIAERMLGEASEDPDMLGDLVSEVTNVMMGGVQRSFLEDGITLTSGLPRRILVSELLAIEARSRAANRVVLHDSALSVWVSASARTMDARKIPVRALREGMVLARDLVKASGVLVLRGGTRLSSSMIERLVLHAPESLAEVC